MKYTRRFRRLNKYSDSNIGQCYPGGLCFGHETDLNPIHPVQFALLEWPVIPRLFPHSTSSLSSSLGIRPVDALVLDGVLSVGILEDFCTRTDVFSSRVRTPEDTTEKTGYALPVVSCAMINPGGLDLPVLFELVGVEPPLKIGT